jgi:hypothetical protein
MRGEKGTGKGTFAQIMTDIFSHHALHVSNSRHVSGNFNAHLVDVLLLFLDEAFWAGDKQGEGVLKALITEKSIPIEPKGVDLFSVPNRLKIIIASNSDWVVPASGDERRYFVLDVSSARRGDLDYFDKLHKALAIGETSAFLQYLQTMDLSNFNVRGVPHTKGLNKQKLLSADSLTVYWYGCLWEGTILGLKPHGVTGWPNTVPNQAVHAAYMDHAHAHGDRHPLPVTEFGKKLPELWPGLEVPIVRPEGKFGILNRPRRYQLASLQQHRDAFLTKMNINPVDHPWPGETDNG